MLLLFLLKIAVLFCVIISPGLSSIECAGLLRKEKIKKEPR
jgi:hypothetical protein